MIPKSCRTIRIRSCAESKRAPAMNEPAQPADKIIAPRAFWRAIGHRAMGSTVVTARSDTGPAGFLGLSATHLGADPPLMMVSIDRRASGLPGVMAGGP